MICKCGKEVEEARIELLGSSICSTCASRVNTERVCGVMQWSNKTAPTLAIASKETIDMVNRAEDRKGQSSILRKQIVGGGRLL